MDLIDVVEVSVANLIHSLMGALVGSICIFLVLRSIGRVFIIDNAVFVQTQHCSEFIEEACCSSILIPQFEFNTMFFHGSAVDLLGREAHHRSNYRGNEHIGSKFVEQVYVKGDPVLEPPHFNTEILLSGSLPACLCVRRLIFIDFSAGFGERSIIKPTGRGLIASYKTIRVTEFHLAPPRHRLSPEFVLGQHISNRN